MFAYWFLLFVPSILSLPSSASRKRPHAFLFSSVFAVYLILVGLRDHVGMDWNNYINLYYRDFYNSFGDALLSYEPGFSLLQWLMVRLEWGVYGVNFVSALVFNIGLFSYARKCVNPWLALAAATPFLVVVVAMSGTRQAMSIGGFLLVLAYWEEMGSSSKVAFLLLVSTFHASALALLAFVLYDLRLTRIAHHIQLATIIRFGLMAGVASLAVIYLPATDVFKKYEHDFFIEGIVAPGAFQHMALNVIPASLYFVFRNRFRQIVGVSRVFEAICFLSIGLLPFVFIASAAVDRFALYFSVVQMTVISALPSLAGFRGRRTLIQMGILVYLSLILLIWLNFSNSASAWIPYGNLWSMLP